jgi:hypothetical protein
LDYKHKDRNQEDQLEQLRKEHDNRVTCLLKANNGLLERERAANRKIREAIAFIDNDMNPITVEAVEKVKRILEGEES